ncbi:MAG: AMP phosphorylase [Candidatus Micrarchaeota archaeon]|nr:AMP phosphorylase [Candidatus Micrarchaeota archaeon]
MANNKEIPHRIHKFRARILDIEAGKNIAILNEEEATYNDIYISDRVSIRYKNKEVIAIIDTSQTMVKKGDVAIYKDIAEQLKIKEGELVEIQHIPIPKSLEYIRKKLDREILNENEIYTIVKETVENRLSEGELASFVAAAYINGFGISETVALAKAMVETGVTLDLNVHPIADKHCIGGVAGNRTTMLIVPILASAGVYIPKTSSRAISSASGTADTFEVFAPVVLPLEELREVVLKTKGCIAWGGAINLAPVDDKLIRIRNSLHLDPKGLLLASILGKKKAVGAEYLIVDIPIGRGAKVENEAEGRLLANDFLEVSEQLGIKTRCLITDGSDPIGKGIGPGLECLEVLKALKMTGGDELREKSCLMAGSILEMLGKVPPGKGAEYAFNIVKSGKAYEKFKEIIEAQGGNPNIKEDDIPVGKYRYQFKSEKSGRVSHVDNKYINKIARVAGAPKDKGAGIILHCEMGDKINVGDVLFEIVSESEAKLSFAIEMARAIPPVELQKMILGKIE